MKRIWLPVGLISLFLGVLGVILPVLPTTPFILLSSWCFARSSPKLQRWLHQSKVFGPMLKRWEHDKCISKKVKFYALSSIAFFGGTSLYFFVPAGWPFWITLLLLAIGITTVLRIKTCQ